MKTIDYKFHELCDEVDYWKEQSEYYEKLYKEEIQRSNDQTNKSLEIAKEGVANALMFALSVKDDVNGNLIITKEDRLKLAKNYK